MIAQVIKDSTIKYKGLNKNMINKTDLINDLCNVFISDNIRFDYRKFEDACD